ncbi:ATP-binding protein [Candidatus Altiarchaeota archaeon]
MASVGRVIGSTSLRSYRFVIKKEAEKHVRRDEFVTVEESVTGIEILGVIKEINITNELLPDEFGRDLRISDFILGEGEYPVVSVKVLGYKTPGGLELPRHGIKPGSEVSLASDQILKEILDQDPDKSLHVGSLSTREKVPVYLSANELVSRHCAVLAMTGAGKSYSVGVVVEELMKKKASVVVFDPHGEYKQMRFDDSKVKIFSLEGDKKIKIEAASLEIPDFANLIPDLTTTQQDLLDEILSVAYRFYEKYDFKLILKILHLLYELKKGGELKNHDLDLSVFPEPILRGIVKKVGLPSIGGLMRRIRRLDRMRIFEIEGTKLDEVVSGNQLSVIDLSDADERISETIISIICRGIFYARRRYVKDEENGGNVLPIPCFIVVEEAHNFIPRSMDERTVLSKYILRRIAREGRKFGVGLCIVSQRPGKLDSDVLSQCNTQLIMKIVNPADQEYIRQSVESVTEDVVKDLPGLALGEAIISGSAVKVAVPVKIRERETEVGGSDIDIVGMWEKK